MRLPPEILESETADEKVRDAPGGETVAAETRERRMNRAMWKCSTDVTRDKRVTISPTTNAPRSCDGLRAGCRSTRSESIPAVSGILPAPSGGSERSCFHDLLIGVTHFFRDRASFASLEANIPQLFAGKSKEDQVRVWAAGCATGEEAYSIAMLLCEHAERLDAPPSIQVFATDVDEQAIDDARQGLYPSTIEADVSAERLRRFFAKDHGLYRVRKALREKVLFAAHNLLEATRPFRTLRSRLLPQPPHLSHAESTGTSFSTSSIFRSGPAACSSSAERKAAALRMRFSRPWTRSIVSLCAAPSPAPLGKFHSFPRGRAIAPWRRLRANFPP